MIVIAVCVSLEVLNYCYCWYDLIKNLNNTLYIEFILDHTIKHVLNCFNIQNMLCIESQENDYYLLINNDQPNLIL